jgi:hypothetical protein
MELSPASLKPPDTSPLKSNWINTKTTNRDTRDAGDDII